MYEVSYRVHSLDFTGTFQGTWLVRCVQCHCGEKRSETAAGPAKALEQQSDGGGDNGSLCCPHPSVLKMPGNPCLSYRKFAHSSALAGASPCLSETTNSRVQCPRGELKTTVN